MTVSGRQAGAQPASWSVSVTPAIAALAVVCAASALAGVVTGLAWLVHVAVAVAVVSGTGVLMRAVRSPAPLVVLGQLFALLCLLVTVFTRSGWLVFFPGPTALNDLVSRLTDSIDEVQTGVPPVVDSIAMRCLIVVAIGLVAVLVDTLAVGAAAPAASGLVLLCVFAVPASLAEQMLPAWTFVLGAAAFTLLLAVDGQHRHQAWRGRNGGVSSGSGGAAVSVTSIAVVIALAAGSALTFVGTVGRLPGSSKGVGGGVGAMGIKPMTNLRGMLSQGTNQELFHVKGLPQDLAYMRVSTLRQYVPGEGWVVGTLAADSVTAKGNLPTQPGDTGGGRTTKIEIDPVGWADNWLPTYGRPRRIDGVDDNWRFDPSRGVVFSERARKSGPFTLEAVLDQPTADELRSTSGPSNVDRGYSEIDGVDRRVSDLAQQITKYATNDFDRASALSSYFTTVANGYTYSTQTKQAVSSDALYDFIFNGKTGFCEQYASAMAVMARTIGLPARVAVGFTAGFQTSDYRAITNQDAHAWVEVFFPGQGWMVFDPTPLGDGRAVVPPYLQTGPTGQANGPDGGVADTTTTTTTTAGEAATTTAVSGQNQAGAAPPDQTPAWHWWALGVSGALALLLTVLLLLAERGAVRLPRSMRPALVVAATGCWVTTVGLAVALLSWLLTVLLILVGAVAAPATVRALRRRTRLHEVSALGPRAASAAWQELLAESVDRGTLVPPTETVRVTARRLAREHDLDERGRDGLRSVVGAVERSWYSSRPDADATLPKAVHEVRESFARNAPLALRAKVLPRSVLSPTSRSAGDDT